MQCRARVGLVDAERLGVRADREGPVRIEQHQHAVLYDGHPWDTRRHRAYGDRHQGTAHGAQRLGEPFSLRGLHATTGDAAVEAVAVCREHDLPIVNRGGGTSLAGQCTNEAVVLDFSNYCHRVLSIDADRRRCVVEPLAVAGTGLVVGVATVVR